MISLKDLETLVWVARLRGFRAAAEKLNTTQPSISSRVASVERSLGIVLFDRGPRGTVLTSKGRELLAYAERLLALRDEMIAVAGSPESIRGVVRLGVAETIVHTWLANLMERLHDTYPHITLDVEVDTTPNLREALLAQALDVGLLLGPLAEPRTRSELLSTYPLSFVARAGSSLASIEGRIPIPTLRSQPLITYPRSTRPYANVRDALSIPGEPAPRIYANASLSTIVKMTLEGIGTAVIPAVLVERELSDGRLVVLPGAPTLPALTFTATWLAEATDVTVRAVIGSALRVAGEHPFAARGDNLDGSLPIQRND